MIRVLSTNLLLYAVIVIPIPRSGLVQCREVLAKQRGELNAEDRQSARRGGALKLYWTEP